MNPALTETSFVVVLEMKDDADPPSSKAASEGVSTLLSVGLRLTHPLLSDSAFPPNGSLPNNAKPSRKTASLPVEGVQKTTG
jgi:hypothetical protein